jgi:hypothetical protein
MIDNTKQRNGEGNMRTTNTLIRTILIAASTSILLAWTVSAVLAQGTSTPDRPLSNVSNVGTRYLVMIEHAGSGDCQDAMRQFSSAIKSSTGMGDSKSYSQQEGKTGVVDGGTGMGTDKGAIPDKSTVGAPGASGLSGAQTSAWQWGCSNEDKTIYLFTNASSADAALNQIPAEMRSRARAVKMSQFAALQGQQMPGEKPKKPDESRTPGSNQGY